MKLGLLISIAVLGLFRIVLAFLVFNGSYKAKICLFKTYEELYGNFDENCTLLIAFGRMGIFILLLILKSMGIADLSTFCYLLQCLKVFTKQIFHLLCHSYPRYFIVFQYLWNVLFSSSLSQSTCHLYMERLLIFMLVLYFATVLRLFIYCVSFFVEFLGSLIFITISFTGKCTLTSSFSIYICFDLLLFSYCLS